MRRSTGISEEYFYHVFGCRREDIRKNVIITPFGEPSSFYPGTKTGGKVFRGRLFSGADHAIGDSAYTVIKCPMGQGYVGDCVIFLGTAGVEKLVYRASCGGLGELLTGDIVIGKRAFPGGDFTETHSYLENFETIFSRKSLYEADCGVLDKICALSEKNIYKKTKIIPGDVFTIGSLTAETPDVLRAVEKEGFAAVDMELSAVYYASILAGISSVGILCVSDTPLTRPFWADPTKEESLKTKQAFKVSRELSSCAF